MRRWGILLAGLLLAVSTLVPGEAAAPTQILDPAGDANYANDQLSLASNEATKDQSLGDVETQGAGNPAGDLLRVWFTNDATTLSLHIVTAAPPSGPTGLVYSVWTNPGSGPVASSSLGCLAFHAYVKSGRTLDERDVVTEGAEGVSTFGGGTFGWMQEICAPKEEVYGYYPADLEFRRNRDGTGELVLTVLRASSSRLRDGARIAGPIARVTHVSQPGTVVPYYWLASYASGYVVPWTVNRGAIDTTKRGSSYQVRRSGVDRIRDVATIGTGEHAFWNGRVVPRETSRAFFYGLRVSETASRLRVALTTPRPESFYGYFEVELIGPRGQQAYVYPYYGMDLEGFIEKPAPGRWLMVVRPWVYPKSAFRMRARLETAPLRPATPRLLRPNLRVEPPFDFSWEQRPHWVFPDEPVSGAYSSCDAAEAAEYRSNRCLRFAVGVQNAGQGPLALHFQPATGDQLMYQVLRYTNGRTLTRPAGTYEYHKVHGHFHYTGFSSLELFRVANARSGKLVRAGTGHKAGFCLGDVVLADWNRFGSDPPQSVRSDCGYMTGPGAFVGAPPTSDAWMGISTGWADIYGAGASGNYVDFGDNPDGLYVVRATVDPGNRVMESSERDNVGYAYVRVAGGTITLLERGHGLHPWDPAKIVIGEWWSKLGLR